jgi:outer membrane protein
MKKELLIIAFVLATSFAQAQKVAYVDVDYVLKNIPEYNDAQKQIDDIAAAWQKEIDGKYAEIDKLYKQYQAEQVLLTDDMKQQRQKEIEDKEKAAKDLQKKRFGYQGDLFQKRQELIQPIQDKVYDAIQKIATTKAYDFVLDKSSGSVVLFANTKLNISDQVLQSMGINPNKAKASDSGGKDTNSDQDKTPDSKTDDQKNPATKTTPQHQPPK